MSNIILTGFMGSGKSTIGRALAKRLKSYFLDTDSLIETFENKSITQIFKEEGEEGFREKERYCFEWLRDNVKNSVVSVGGGFPVFIPQIREAGFVIYLKVPFSEIVKRLNKEELSKRPLFQDIKKAKELYKKRDKIYSKLAHLTIENKDIQKTLQEILKAINGA
jgi:shikimate kinase